MNATTLELVKRYLPGGADDTADDPVLAGLVPSITATAEKFLRRSIEKTERTVTLDWRCGRRRIMLPAYPVDPDADFEIRNDTWRQWGDDTIVDPSCYAVDYERGVVCFDMWLPQEGFQVLRVTWTGGMAATVEDLAAAYPDVVKAITLQVVHEYRRRTGLDITSLSMEGQSVGLAKEMGTLAYAEDLLSTERREGLIT